MLDHPSPELVFLSYSVTGESGTANLTPIQHLPLHDQGFRQAEFLNDIVIHPSGNFAVANCYSGKIKFVVLKDGKLHGDFDVKYASLLCTHTNTYYHQRARIVNFGTGISLVTSLRAVPGDPACQSSRTYTTCRPRYPIGRYGTFIYTLNRLAAHSNSFAVSPTDRHISYLDPNHYIYGGPDCARWHSGNRGERNFIFQFSFDRLSDQADE
jgi:hypothetical protein